MSGKTPTYNIGSKKSVKTTLHFTMICIKQKKYKRVLGTDEMEAECLLRCSFVISVVISGLKLSFALLVLLGNIEQYVWFAGSVLAKAIS